MGIFCLTQCYSIDLPDAMLYDLLPGPLLFDCVRSVGPRCLRSLEEVSRSLKEVSRTLKEVSRSLEEVSRSLKEVSS
jgi:hypothetical protein